jgi:hypothetical protein
MQMQKGPLEERRAALEEAFFAKHNEQLLARMREADAQKAAREGLIAASGVTDAAVLDRLVALGIRAETLSALRLIPLVLVAWADGPPPPEERTAVMGGAVAAGIAPATTAHKLLEGWLAHRPGPDVAEAWHAYARALTTGLPVSERDALRASVLREARAVSDARGGFLGFPHRTSAQEAVVLHWVEAALGG